MTAILTEPVEAPVITELTVQDVCGLAAEYIEEHGWCQFALYKADGRTCAMGAAYKVLGIEGLEDRVNTPEWKLYKAYDGAIKSYVNNTTLTDMHPDTAFWNDAEGQTKDEVVRVLRSIANS